MLNVAPFELGSMVVCGPLTADLPIVFDSI